MIYKHILIACFALFFIPIVISQDNKGELSLDSCVLIALQNNYELKAFEQNKNMAVEQYQMQKATLFPTINLNSEYLFTDQFEALNIFKAGNASIQLYQTIWQNGKPKSVIRQAKINTEASDIRFTINRNDIAYYTAASYIDLIRNKKIEALTTEILSRFKVTVDAAQERFQLGASKRSDVLKAKTEFSNIEYYLIQLRTLTKIAEQNLLKSIGLKQDLSIKTKDFLESKDLVLESLQIDSLIKIATENLPELKLINKRIEHQEQSVMTQKKNQSPEIRAFANYNWSDNPIYSKNAYGAAGISLRLNIFAGFQNRHSIALEKVRLSQLKFQEDEIMQAIINEIQIAKLRFVEAQEKINNALARIKSSKESLDVTTEEYQQGLSSMLELVNVQYVDFEAKQSLINAFAEYQLAVLTLKRKTGILTSQYNL